MDEKTLSETISDNFTVGQTVYVSMFNKARLVLMLNGVLKQEDDNGQYYIRDIDKGVFLIFTDMHYESFSVNKDNSYIKLCV